MGYDNLSYACWAAASFPSFPYLYRYAISAPHMVLFTGLSKYNVFYKGNVYMNSPDICMCTPDICMCTPDICMYVHTRYNNVCAYFDLET